MATYGYARVSSKSQEDKFGLEMQFLELKKSGVDEIYKDVWTGTTMHRPDWEKLMEIVEEGDTIVTPRLDRIARTAIEGCITVKDLVSRGITVKVLNMGTIENTPMGRMILTVMFAMAEYDRDMIVERLAAARAVAKKTNPEYREGRKRIAIADELLDDMIEAVSKNLISKREAARRLGVGDATFRRRMEERNAS